MKQVIIRFLQVNKKKIFIYLLLIVAFNWMYVAMFPSISKDAEQMTELLAAYPQEMFKAFGIENVTTMLSSIEAFLAIENYSILWPILMIIYTISLGVSTVSGEIDDGTIDFLLSQPISRAKLFWAKYSTGFILTTIFTLVSVYSVIPLTYLHNVSYTLPHYHTLFIYSELFALTVYSLTVFFSACFSSKGTTSSASAGVMVLMYVFNLIASLKESIQDLQYISLFYYYDYNGALIDNKLNLTFIGIFIALIVTTSSVGYLIFTKRDIST